MFFYVDYKKVALVCLNLYLMKTAFHTVQTKRYKLGSISNHAFHKEIVSKTQDKNERFFSPGNK